MIQIQRSLSYTVAISCLLTSSSLMFMTPSAQSQKTNGKTVAKKTKVINGEKYTFIKYLDTNGKIYSEVRNSKGRAINEKEVPKGKKYLVDKSVIKQIEKLENAGRTRETIKVNIALELPIYVSKERPESGGIQTSKRSIKRAFINGREISVSELDKHANNHALKEQKKREKRNRIRGEKLRKWAKSYGLENKKGIEEAFNQGRSGVTLRLTPSEIQKLIRSRDPKIAGIELYEEPQDDITSAMEATSISTSALPNSSTRGNGIGIYMTESGCANESRIRDYDRLSGSETNHSRNVGAILRAVSPNSFIYCRGGAVLPQNTDLDGVGGNPPIHIVTRSNSDNDTTNYNTTDRDWDNFVYEENIPVFNSGGNTGNVTGNVKSPGKGLNVITVGNYNDTNNTINSSSPFVDPQTRNDKPELVAPGTNITAGGFTMSGTSQATPDRKSVV